MRKGYGSGIATIAANGDLLDCWFIQVELNPITTLTDRSALLTADPYRDVTKVAIDIEIELDKTLSGPTE